MEYLLIGVVAAGASLLTFFSGFGLGTLLLPVFALFFPVEAAVAMTAVVHLSNNLFKLTLIGRHLDRAVLLRFGLPALLTAWFGAWLLVGLSELPTLTRYRLGSRELEMDWPGIVIGTLMLVFAVRELKPGGERRGVDPKWLPVGGMLTGFLGGLSGHQGALRSAFLIGCGLSKEAFIATGVAIACLVDLSRLSHYLPQWRNLAGDAPLALMGTAILCAFAGAWVGRRLLHKVTLDLLHRFVGGLLLLAGLAMVSGLI